MTDISAHCSHDRKATSRNIVALRGQNEDMLQGASEAASLILKEIDARSSHDGHRLSVIPYLHIC